MLLLLCVPMVFFMMLTSSVSQTTSGIMADENGDVQSFFNLYYREPILNTQREKGVLVPYGWLYGAMWYHNPDVMSQDKVNELIDAALRCEGDSCVLVTLDEYVENLMPILYDRTVIQITVKRNIELFLDSDEIYFGKIPSKMSEYKGLEMTLPYDKSLYYIAASYGLYDPFGTGEWTMHYAVDLTPHEGKEGHQLFSMIDGLVQGKGYDAGGWGYWIKIQSSTHPEFSILYGHMQAPSSLITGANVTQNQAVGILGNTGRSSGAHVHVEFMENNEKFNPELVLSFD